MNNNRKCDLCGRDCIEWTMYSITPSRKTMWLCPDYYLTGQKETGMRQKDKGTKRIREEEKGRFR